MRLVAIIVTVLLVAVLIGVISPDEYYVSQIYQGKHIYGQIQEAINQAKPGSIITVRPGIYRENLIINKPVTLISLLKKKTEAKKAPDFTTGGISELVARHSDQPVLKILTDGVKIIGFKIGGGKYGISLLGVSKCEISYNRVEGNTEGGIKVSGGSGNLLLANKLSENGKGINIIKSKKNTINSNHVVHSANYGIHLEESGGNVLVGNQIRGDSFGLIIENSPGNVLKNNYIEESSHQGVYPFRVWGTEEAHFVQKIDTTNLIDHNPIYYLVDEEDKTIDGSMKPAYVAIVNSRRIKLSNINISNRSEAVTMVNSSNVEVVNSVFRDIGTGIYVWRSKNSLIYGNTIKKASRHGVHLAFSLGNELVKNHIAGSSTNGISLQDSAENRIYENNIEENKEHGIYLKFSNSNQLIENKLVKNQKHGVLLEGAEGNTLLNNLLKENWVGIFIERSDSNIVTTNRIEENKMGIYLDQAVGNEIVHNDFSGNERGNIGGNFSGNKVEK